MGLKRVLRVSGNGKYVVLFGGAVGSQGANLTKLQCRGAAPTRVFVWKGVQFKLFASAVVPEVSLNDDVYAWNADVPIACTCRSWFYEMPAGGCKHMIEAVGTLSD